MPSGRFGSGRTSPRHRYASRSHAHGARGTSGAIHHLLPELAQHVLLQRLGFEQTARALVEHGPMIAQQGERTRERAIDDSLERGVDLLRRGLAVLALEPGGT